MVKYPLLTEQQQQDLPVLIKSAEPIASQFDDSTHQLWYCDTVDGSMVLKICNQHTIQQSTFWQGMNSLFNADFSSSLGKIEMIYHYMDANSPLAIPAFVAAEAETFVLAKWLEGDTVNSASLTDGMVIQLAEHLSELHQHSQATWGAFHHAELKAEQWPIRLQNTLQSLAESQLEKIPDAMLAMALEQAKSVQPENFVPIMPDLRWDQFLKRNDHLSALVDLDAMVWGPVELDFVLLEYLLSEQQCQLFTQRYEKHHKIPSLTRVRKPYRLLLFMMHVLGEQDIDVWMQAPPRF